MSASPLKKMMTFSEIAKSPIGTTYLFVEVNTNAFMPQNAFRATHWEKISGAVKPICFYAETAEAAFMKVLEYDRKRKEQHAKWKRSRQERAGRGV